MFITGGTRMLAAHRIETTLLEDGKLSLDHLPFQAGQSVEVVVLPRNADAKISDELRGSVLRYERPTEPVAESDWDTIR